MSARDIPAKGSCWVSPLRAVQGQPSDWPRARFRRILLLAARDRDRLADSSETADLPKGICLYERGNVYERS